MAEVVLQCTIVGATSVCGKFRVRKQVRGEEGTANAKRELLLRSEADVSFLEVSSSEVLRGLRDS